MTAIYESVQEMQTVTTKCRMIEWIAHFPGVDCIDCFGHFEYLTPDAHTAPKGISHPVRILFTATQDAPFIRDDLSFLRQRYEVNALSTKGLVAIPAIIAGVFKAECTFTWFASVYAAVIVFFARLMGRRSVVVIGGVDAANEPRFGYGIWANPWKAPLIRYAMRHADVLLPVTPFLRDQAIKLAGYDGRNIRVIPTSYDSSFWTPDGTEKEFDILTVASCETVPRMSIKGIPFLLDTARRMPDVRFLLIGPRDEAMNEIQHLDPPSNISFLSPIPREALATYYRKARVYCQPSYYEGGLSSSLCEAMLCGCVPVGTLVGGIPDAIGEDGFLVPFGDQAGLEAALRKALTSPSDRGERARRRIAERFSVDRREEALVDVLGRILA